MRRRSTTPPPGVEALIASIRAQLEKLRNEHPGTAESCENLSALLDQLPHEIEKELREGGEPPPWLIRAVTELSAELLRNLLQ